MQTIAPQRRQLEQLALFRATRKEGIDPEHLPSDADSTEEYSYFWNGAVWCIRCEDERYVYSWTHAYKEDADTLEEAERLLLDMAREW
jgi:hypothetical protein